MKHEECDDRDACTLDFCANKNCTYIPVDCDDHTVCTNDTCNPATGCENTPITCDDGYLCTSDICDSILGCLYPDLDCSPTPDYIAVHGECYEGRCNATSGCWLALKAGSYIDDCGQCNGDGVCFLGLNTAEAAALGAGVLAAIIIGAVAFFLIFSAIGGKVGYDYYKKRQAALSGAQESPIYQESNKQGNNPFYNS